MLATERYLKIVETVNRIGVVTVEELSKTLNVSAMTIRRDLEKLKKMGHLNRCHGGAAPLSTIAVEEGYDKKRTCNNDVKVQIAKTCKQLVKTGNSVFLDGGTTTLEIAMLIKEIPNITIVTNDIKIASTLLNSPVKIILCGGMIQNETGIILGQFSQEMLSSLRVNVSFIGTACIDEEFNVMTPTMEKSFLKRTAMNIANRSYLVADSSKFYHKALVKVTNLSDFTGTVTNKRFCSEEWKIIKKKNIEIINVE